MAGNLEVMERWFDEVWCTLNSDADVGALIDELVADDVKFNGLGPEPLTKEGFRAVRQHFGTKYPNLCIAMVKAVERDDYVVHHSRFTGVHAESSKPVKFLGTGIIYFRGGQVAETYETWDFASMLLQLGVVSEADAVRELGG